MHALIPLVDADRWRAALNEVPHDFFHTWEYNRAVQLTHELDTMLYVFESDRLFAACPISERHFDENTDITTPPGFSGFVGTGDWGQFSSRWSDFAQKQGWVCGYIALNPVLLPSISSRKGTLQYTNDVYVLDLTLDLDELLARMDQGRRRELRRPQPNIISDKKLLTEFFVSQYPHFIRRVNAASSYHRTPQTLRALCEMDNVLLFGVEDEYGISSVYMFTFNEFVATYLVSVTLPSARNLLSSVIWHAIQYLKQSSVPLLNLGAGVRPGDSIARSKQRFGATSHPLNVLTEVYDNAEYARLCEQTGCRETHAGGFFPPYRAPRAQ